MRNEAVFSDISIFPRGGGLACLQSGGSEGPRLSRPSRIGCIPIRVAVKYPSNEECRTSEPRLLRHAFRHAVV
jgi:hypothetical protein